MGAFFLRIYIPCILAALLWFIMKEGGITFDSPDRGICFCASQVELNFKGPVSWNSYARVFVDWSFQGNRCFGNWQFLKKRKTFLHNVTGNAS